MSLDQRIKLARDRAGYSLRALAERAGVSHNAIAKYERGEDIPSSGVLLALADALGVQLDYFFREHTATLQQVRFRKASRCGLGEQRRAEGEALEYLERYRQVEAILGDPLPFDRPDIAWRVTSLADVERVAEELRAAWALGLDPLENLASVLEDKGVRVCLVEGCDGFDGLAAWLEDGLPVIAVRRAIPGDRQRFDLAHELGHLLLELPPEWDEKQGEKAAHRFAGAFLAPAPAVRAELGGRRSDLETRELYLLKHKYGLSMQAWARRARDLEVISQAAYEGICRRFSRNGWRKEEPGDQALPETPRRMEQLVYRALAEDKISRARAAELLGEKTGALEPETELVAA
ncbi:MAG: ImmA/IrrE family metallo-endopeptidase [Chloroflexi bacterium]|nr:ImmA/IrrE family metallo-endopeptidase [Chloroflexota bacterium]